MMFRARIGVTAAFAAGYASSVVQGQQSGWQPDQVNATMCQWKQLRAAQLKDTVYIDGGILSWYPGFANGTIGVPTTDGNPQGFRYMLNFSNAFNASTNVSSILTTLSTVSSGQAANNFAPNYVDGAMLANDDELFLYGGLLSQESEFPPPDDTDVLEYQASSYSTEKSGFLPGFLKAALPENMTRYLTFGGAANAPSENKAWYFGGYTSPTWGPIYQIGDNASFDPTRVSDTFITLDMSFQQHENWSNVSLPTDVPSRANPSVVWVPVGEQGILVVLGGVAYPWYNNNGFSSQNEAESKKDSPGYMSNINIYDIASDKWYTQPTIAGPGQLAMGCAVVATARDMSSYNIYYYGGFDGLDAESPYNDDVWILSLPSFMWMKVSSGDSTHGRIGHQCVMPYPDQMVAIGGARSSTGGQNCLGKGILQVFNLTSGDWLEGYDPEVWNEYGVPEMIHLMIGGDYTGGATMTTPTPTGWATTALASVFATKYPMSKITTYYPYGTAGPSGSPRGTIGGKGGTPSWVAPVLGVVLGLVFITAIVVGILLYRRRKLWLKKKGESENPSSDNRNRIRSWIAGQNGNDKAETVTTEDPSTGYGDVESRHPTPMHQNFYHQAHPPPSDVTSYEMHENTLVELGDTSRMVELSGETFPSESKPAQFSSIPQPRSAHPSSPFLANSAQDQVSSVNSSQPAVAPLAATSDEGLRADSPSLGDTPGHFQPPTPARNLIVSDLSHISEREATHLRNTSNATVSSSATHMSPPNSPPPSQFVFNNEFGSPLLPVSPPSAVGGHEARDYMGAHQGRSVTGLASNNSSLHSTATSHPSRRSVFREHDLGSPNEETDRH